MRKALLSLVTLGMLALGGLTACDDGDKTASPTGGAGGQARVGVILPDTTSADRWENDDKRLLTQQFQKARIPFEIRNAQGDTAAFIRIAEEMIASGVKVLMICNLDSDSGKVVLDKARAAGVKTIDYDRLTLNGAADFYVSFNNETVGKQQAQGLIKCLEDKKVEKPYIATINGSPTDNNATQFKRGYDGVLQKYYDANKLRKGPDQWATQWLQSEGTAIFTQMLQQNPNIGGVLAANDGLATAAIEVLRRAGKAGKVPVTGQDATVPGLQHLLVGEQCMTVFKNIDPLAQKAAALAGQLFRGEKPAVNAQIKDDVSGAYVPYVELDPELITRDRVKDVIATGFVDAKQICTGRYRAACAEAGITVG